VLRLLRSLAGNREKDTEGKEWASRTESFLAFELEEAALLTLGLAYEKRPRFSGGAYRSALRRVDEFLDEKLPRALERREERAAKLLELDDAVSAAVAKLKERGFQSPYLKAFVVARVNPLRFYKGEPPEYDDLMETMQRAAARFNVEKVREADIARSGGPPEAAAGEE
jgi:ParB family chromosome partitioning protein